MVEAHRAFLKAWIRRKISANKTTLQASIFAALPELPYVVRYREIKINITKISRTKHKQIINVIH